MMVFILRTIYAAAAAVFSLLLFKDVKKHKKELKKESGSVVAASSIGIVVNFFDALAIGSFATSTVLLRLFKQVPDRLLPGTLNVMCLLPALAEAFIYLGVIQVDYLTFICMVGAAALGGWLGAKYVVKLPERKIQVAMTIALFVAGTVMLLKQTHLFPMGVGESIGFTGIKLVIATMISAIAGSLCNVGIGIFAPLLATSTLLGMNAKSVFPIMMAAAAAGSYGGSIIFLRTGAYNRKVATCMGIFGLIGVLIAAYIVKSLPLNILTWLVIVIIYYASSSLFFATGIPQKLMRRTKT